MKIILAYSGGLDTSVLVHWYAKQQNAEVITYCAGVGQEEELEGLEEKALSTGATAHRTLDLVDEFARDFIYPMVRGNAVYESQYLLGTSIAPFDCQGPNRYRAGIRSHRGSPRSHWKRKRPVSVRTYLFCPCSRSSDSCTLERRRISRNLSRTQANDRILRQARYRREASASKPYSMDRNLWHISYEAGILEDPWFDPTTPDNRDMYKLTVDPELAPDEAQYLELTFERGDCVAIDGESGSPLEIVRKLNVIAGKHGIGRVDLVENRFVGMKSRGVYETPGGTILLHAHRQLETLTMDRDLMHLRDSLIPRYAELIYYGFWYAPEREALQALIDHSQDTVSGVVRLKLYKGNLTTVGRKSELSLYDLEVASMDDDESDYQPEDAGGFIRLNALRLKERSRKQGYTAS